jgi:hypothetical protein
LGPGYHKPLQRLTARSTSEAPRPGKLLSAVLRLQCRAGIAIRASGSGAILSAFTSIRQRATNPAPYSATLRENDRLRRLSRRQNTVPHTA